MFEHSAVMCALVKTTAIVERFTVSFELELMLFYLPVTILGLTS